MMAKRLGVRRLYMLDDGEPYGIGIAASVRKAAGELGAFIAGSGRWDKRERGYRALARRIARSRDDGVFLGGIGVSGANGATLVRDLRAVLGRRVEILA